MAHSAQDPHTGRPAQAARNATAASPRLDSWAQRERPRVDSVFGYSRFVRIMKVMLPLVAISLITLVVIYSTAGNDRNKVAITFEKMNAVDKDRQLVKPKLTGTDGRGQPFTVTAKGATQAPGKIRRVMFDEVVADVTLQDKSWVQLDAKVGLLDGDAKTLDLRNSINIFSDKGYECHTTSARYDIEAGLLKGDNPIQCQGPLGLISSNRFEGLRDAGIIRFTGGVSTTYYPTPREGTARDAAETNPEGIAEVEPDEDAAYSGPAPATAHAPSPPVLPKFKPVTP